MSQSLKVFTISVLTMSLKRGGQGAEGTSSVPYEEERYYKTGYENVVQHDHVLKSGTYSHVR